MNTNLVVIEQGKLLDMINQAVQQATAHLEPQNELPPLLTRKQFMELIGIGETKCAELFNRQDFPVNRDFGHPRVPTKLLFDWIYANTEWIETNAPKFKHPIRAI